MTPSPLLLLLVLIGTPALEAQAPRGPVPMRVGLTAASGELLKANSATLELRRQVAADSVRQTQWLKGGVIGGVLMGTLTALLSVEVSNNSDMYRDEGFPGPFLGGFLLGGGLGFFIGALIGAQFEK